MPQEPREPEMAQESGCSPLHASFLPEGTKFVANIKCGKAYVQMSVLGIHSDSKYSKRKKTRPYLHLFFHFRHLPLQGSPLLFRDNETVRGSGTAAFQLPGQQVCDTDRGQQARETRAYLIICFSVGRWHLVFSVD